MTWSTGKRTLKQYKSLAEGKEAFKSLWKNKYGNRFPDLRLAQIYSGNDNASGWLKTITYCYNNINNCK